MTDSVRLTFRRGDFLAIAAVLLLAAGLTVWLTLQAMAAETVTARIYLEGELVRECSLDIDSTFTVTGAYQNTVTVRNGEIAVTASDCPGGDCVHSGRIHQAGRSIVCLPNRMELQLVGDADSAVDMVAG